MHQSYYNNFVFQELPDETPVVPKKRRLSKSEGESSNSMRYEWGTLDMDLFIRKLKQEGISDGKVEKNNNGYIIHLVRIHP